MQGSAYMPFILVKMIHDLWQMCPVSFLHFSLRCLDMQKRIPYTATIPSCIQKTISMRNGGHHEPDPENSHQSSCIR